MRKPINYDKKVLLKLPSKDYEAAKRLAAEKRTSTQAIIREGLTMVLNERAAG